MGNIPRDQRPRTGEHQELFTRATKRLVAEGGCQWWDSCSPDLGTCFYHLAFLDLLLSLQVPFTVSPPQSDYEALKTYREHRRVANSQCLPHGGAYYFLW